MMSRPLYVSTSCLPGTQFVLPRLLTYIDRGLHHIELGAGVWANDDLLQLADLDCKLLIHNYFPPADHSFVLNLASSNKEIREDSIEFVYTALDLCTNLRVPFYSLHAGFITDPVGFGSRSFIFPMPDSPDEERKAMDRFISSLELCITRASRLGLQILIENNVCSPDLRGKLLLQRAEEFLALFDALPSPNLGALLDTGHLKVSAHTCGFDKMKFVEDLAGFIRAFHVHDNCGFEDSHLPITPGSWVINVLRKLEFAELPIVIEAKFNHVNHLLHHVNWLQGEVS